MIAKQSVFRNDREFAKMHGSTLKVIKKWKKEQSHISP